MLSFVRTLIHNFLQSRHHIVLLNLYVLLPLQAAVWTFESVLVCDIIAVFMRIISWSFPKPSKKMIISLIKPIRCLRFWFSIFSKRRRKEDLVWIQFNRRPSLSHVWRAFNWLSCLMQSVGVTRICRIQGRLGGLFSSVCSVEIRTSTNSSCVISFKKFFCNLDEQVIIDVVIRIHSRLALLEDMAASSWWVHLHLNHLLCELLLLLMCVGQMRRTCVWGHIVVFIARRFKPCSDFRVIWSDCRS